MYQEISQLLMYGDLDEDSILAQMGEVFGKYETGEYNKTGLVRDINTQVKRILKVATDYGFDDNQWHNYTRQSNQCSIPQSRFPVRQAAKCSSAQQITENGQC